MISKFSTVVLIMIFMKIYPGDTTQDHQAWCHCTVSELPRWLHVCRTADVQSGPRHAAVRLGGLVFASVSRCHVQVSPERKACFILWDLQNDSNFFSSKKVTEDDMLNHIGSFSLHRISPEFLLLPFQLPLRHLGNWKMQRRFSP